MTKRVRVKIGDKWHQVELSGTLINPIKVLVDGEPVEVLVEGFDQNEIPDSSLEVTESEKIITFLRARDRRQEKHSLF